MDRVCLTRPIFLRGIMKTKKDRNYSFKHTKLRILQRYNFEIDQDIYDYLCHMVKYGIRAELISEEEQKGDVQKIYDLRHDLAPPIRVVWSEKRQCITTAIKRKHDGKPRKT